MDYVHHSPYSKKATGDEEVIKYLKNYIHGIINVKDTIYDEYGTLIGEIKMLPKKTVLYHKTDEKWHYSICKNGWRKGITFFCKNKKLCNKAYVGISEKKKQNKYSFIKNEINNDLLILDIKSDYIISNPFTVDGISDNRSFFLPEKIQKMAQAFDYSNFSPRKGKYKAKWELFRNYEMLYQKICKKFKFDGWSAVVSSDQVSDDSLKEIAIIDAASKMNLFKCDTNGNYCMPASEYIKLKKKKKKKKRKSGSESGRKRKKSYVPKPPSFKNKNKKKLHSHRIFHQSKKI